MLELVRRHLFRAVVTGPEELGADLEVGGDLLFLEVGVAEDADEDEGLSESVLEDQLVLVLRLRVFLEKKWSSLRRALILKRAGQFCWRCVKSCS